MSDTSDQVPPFSDEWGRRIEALEAAELAELQRMFPFNQYPHYWYCEACGANKRPGVVHHCPQA